MRYYFLGICGTAMASLAVLLKKKGHQVWGTDHNIYPPMSDYLLNHDIPITEGYDPKNLAIPFDKAVIGNALTRGNSEVEAILNQRLSYTSMPEILKQEFLSQKIPVVVTGTHGKTTTTALISWLLHYGKLNPSFLIGGISKNFEASATLGSGKYFVIEGDEYDTAFFDKRPKFLHYFPYFLVINNIEYDHSDIYGDLNQIKGEFRKLIRLIPANGLIIANGDDPVVREILSPVYSQVIFFGKGSSNNYCFKHVTSSSNGLHFMVTKEHQNLGKFITPLHGEYQLYNSLAAIIVAIEIGLDLETIRSGLLQFRNVKRRLEFWGQFNCAPFYDDFAHHPTAISKTLKALKLKHTNRRLIAIFEPRTNTTVKNIFQRELTEALSKAEVIILAPLHRPDRIKTSERLSLNQLKRDLTHLGKTVYILKSCREILNILEKIVLQSDMIVLMTNGNLGGFYSDLRNSIVG